MLPLGHKPKLLASIGAFLAGTAVLAGAFGRHALTGKFPADRLDVFETAARYQMLHALAVILCALFLQITGQKLFARAGGCFVLGILIFSGSLYLIVFSQLRFWGALTPIGGSLFLAGWFFFFRACLAKP